MYELTKLFTHIQIVDKQKKKEKKNCENDIKAWKFESIQKS